MKAHETLIVEMLDSSAGTLSPGGIQRCLCATLRLSSDDIGMIQPLGRGRAGVEIALTRAMSLSTPLTLSGRSTHGPFVLKLRRQNDPRGVSPREIRVRWSGQKRVTPGHLVRALVELSAGRFSSDDLGASFEGSDLLISEVSEGLASLLNLPSSHTIDDVHFTIERERNEAL